MTDHLCDFLRDNQLDKQYLEQASRWFQLLLEDLVDRSHHTNDNRTLLVGISGCQGSGKSTLANYLTLQLNHSFGLTTEYCSLDDFYLSRSARQTLSETVHPLLATRGVPGTHCVENAITALTKISRGQSTGLPIFDKSTDDISDKVRTIPAGLDIFIFEGWCLGASHQNELQLKKAINQLERNEDSDGQWRQYVNQQLETNYRDLFNLLDCMIMLKAPSFDSVYNWRLEQEQKLAAQLHQADSDADLKQLMSEAQIARFIQFYQRITQHLLERLPQKSDHLYLLDEQRNIQAHTFNKE